MADQKRKDFVFGLELWFEKGVTYIIEWLEDKNKREYFRVMRRTRSAGGKVPVYAVEILLNKTYSHAEAWDAVNRDRKGA